MPLMKQGAKEKCWIRYIKNRIKNKKNFLGFISGPTGSGKSWAGLTICSQLDPDFGPDRIVTSMRQLMRLINSNTLSSGSCVLWDEAGIDVSSKAWQSLTNKLINFLMQTFRHKRYILIFTSPYLDFIDASTRKLFHAEFSMKNIDYRRGVSVIKPNLIQYNSRNRKFYYKYIRVRDKRKMKVKITRWLIEKPDVELIKQYEKIKSDFTSKLNLDIERQLIEEENKKYKKVRKDLTQLQETSMQLMARYKDINRVSSEMGIAKRTIYFHIQQAERKGYELSDFKPDKG